MEWGANGSARSSTDGGTVWEANCPNSRQPITGTCVVLKSEGPVALQNFGVNSDNNHWECAWTGRVVAANVRALCQRR
jgi:hypothetical protein